MTVAGILDRIRSLRVLVIGDICLDRWCWYDPAVSIPSVETGLIRTAVVRTITTPGAGGTVANNLAALGAGTVKVLGVIGDDGFGWELRRALARQNISSDLLLTSVDLNTFTYTKLINQETDREDMGRVDFINTVPMPRSAEEQVIVTLEREWPNFEVIIVSDQAETQSGGIVTAAVRDCINRKASEFPETVVWVDSRKRPELFSNVYLKPNNDEAEDACRRKFGTVDFARLASECQTRLLIVTQGESGALVYERNHDPRLIPTRRVKAVDICGAGDSFSAGASCAFAVTRSGIEAAKFGNLVASITVMKKGTGTASPNELLEAEGALS